MKEIIDSICPKAFELFMDFIRNDDKTDTFFDFKFNMQVGVYIQFFKEYVKNHDHLKSDQMQRLLFELAKFHLMQDDESKQDRVYKMFVILEAHLRETNLLY